MRDNSKASKPGKKEEEEVESSKASKLRKEMVEKDPSWVIDNSKASKYGHGLFKMIQA